MTVVALLSVTKIDITRNIGSKKHRKINDKSGRIIVESEETC